MISHEDAPEIAEPAVCLGCGAQRAANDESCWLCGAESKPVIAPPVQTTRESVVIPQQPFSFRLSTMMLMVTLAAVCFGLLAAAPGLAIPMCVLLVPVLVRTSMVVSRRQAAGLPVSSSQKLGLFLSSFAVTTVLSIVVLVAAFCSFCGVCLLAFGAGSTDTEMAVWGIGLCAVALAAVIGIVFMVKWIIHRYRRDIRG